MRLKRCSSVHIVSRQQDPTKPFNALNVGRVVIFTVCLYASSFTIILSERSHKKGKDNAMKIWLLLTIGLGATFLVDE